jgi:6-phosphofructokinase 2
MTNIATLTLNPTIDVSYEVEKVVPTHKMRTLKERYDPGGGGINVARVFVRLGGTACCYYLSGGATGPALDGLLDAHKLDRRRIPIAGPTRVSSSILAQDSGREYRFVPPGPTVSPAEWQECLDRLVDCDFAWFVASGSLPPGVPEDFYGRVAEIVSARGAKMVLDSSGAGLRGGLASGKVHLVKPSIGELRQLSGQALASQAEAAAAAKELVTRGCAELVALTMGHQGGMLASKDGVVRVPALPLEAKSAVGAGDSFLAAMVFALADGGTPLEAFRFGIAGGTAAVLTHGTGLAYPEDIARLYPQVAAGEAL